MSDTNPGADELRIRSLLVARGVGPAAIPPKPAAPPKPTVRPRDWLDDILDTDPTPAAEDAPEPETVAAPAPAPAAKEKPARPRPKPRRKKRKKGKQGKQGGARTAWDTRPPSPRQSLTEAWDQVPYRLKWLAYHATAAYLGWCAGLVGWATYVTGWIADTGLVGPQAFFWYGVAGAQVLAYRRTRSWWTPAAWLAAVPLTSTVVGVLLYAPHP